MSIRIAIFLLFSFSIACACAKQSCNDDVPRYKEVGSGIMTWYSFEDNQNSIGSNDNPLELFVSVAVRDNSNIPFRKRLFIPCLRGFRIGRDTHDGWVRVDDVCKGSRCEFLDVYVGSQKERYRDWMRSNCACDPDQVRVTAYEKNNDGRR